MSRNRLVLLSCGVIPFIFRVTLLPTGRCARSEGIFRAEAKLSVTNTIHDSRRCEMSSMQDKRGYICDMDGVIYHGNRLLDGAKEFVQWLHDNDKKFLFLTNSSERSPRELQEKLARMGLNVTEDHFYTSALATASFLARQEPNGTAY